MEGNKFCYEYPRPALSTDCIIFGFNGNNLNVLLIERGGKPFKGYWALPGGFVQIDENAEESALRELTEETGMKNVMLEQLHTFTDVNRHPDTRVITIAYLGLVRISDHRIKAGDDANNAGWFSLKDIQNLAFDHNRIIEMAKDRLKDLIRFRPEDIQQQGENFSEHELKLILNSIT